MLLEAGGRRLDIQRLDLAAKDLRRASCGLGAACQVDALLVQRLDLHLKALRLGKRGILDSCESIHERSHVRGFFCRLALRIGKICRGLRAGLVRARLLVAVLRGVVDGLRLEREELGTSLRRRGDLLEPASVVSQAIV